jgi:hypothetical protein
MPKLRSRTRDGWGWIFDESLFELRAVSARNRYWWFRFQLDSKSILTDLETPQRVVCRKFMWTRGRIGPSEPQLRVKRRCSMNCDADFVEKLKWSIYDWIGAISVSEISTNQNLRQHIEGLFRKLSALSALEAV